MKTKLLFVCLGNICRSPTAEGVMKHIVNQEGAAESFLIDSAGTYGGHRGELPDARMRRAAAKRGYNLNSHSRQITTDDFEKFDLIVVMDDSNYELVCRLAPTIEAVQKVYRMTYFCSQHSADHIPDPYYEGTEGFEIVLDLLEDACQGLWKNIKSNQV